jgi:drug/metabolite transporter (DMT)-like permease
MSAAPRVSPATGFRMATRDWLMLLLCSVCWGSAYTFNKLIIPEIAPLTITAGRLAIACVFLTALVRLSGHVLPPFGRAWLPFFVFTLFSNVIPFVMVLKGQKETASGLAAVLGATTPLFLIILAHLFTTDERMEPRKLAGVLVGIIGVAVVMGADALAGWSTALGAKLLLVAASVLYAIGAVYSKRLVGHPPLVIAAMQMTCGLLISAPMALLIDQPWTQAMPSQRALLALAGTAIIGSSFAAVTYFHVLRRAGATNAMFVTLLVPVTPILLGGMLYGERLLLRELAGATIIAAALLIIDGRLTDMLWARYRILFST